MVCSRCVRFQEPWISGQGGTHLWDPFERRLWLTVIKFQGVVLRRKRGHGGRSTEGEQTGAQPEREYSPPTALSQPRCGDNKPGAAQEESRSCVVVPTTHRNVFPEGGDGGAVWQQWCAQCGTDAVDWRGSQRALHVDMFPSNPLYIICTVISYCHTILWSIKLWGDLQINKIINRIEQTVKRLRFFLKVLCSTLIKMSPTNGLSSMTNSRTRCL